MSSSAEEVAQDEVDQKEKPSSDGGKLKIHKAVIITFMHCFSIFCFKADAKKKKEFGGDFFKDFYYSQGDYTDASNQEKKQVQKHDSVVEEK